MKEKFIIYIIMLILMLEKKNDIRFICEITN